MSNRLYSEQMIESLLRGNSANLCAWFNQMMYPPDL